MLLLLYLHEQQKVACLAALDSCPKYSHICFWRVRSMLRQHHCRDNYPLMDIDPK